jgi:hypothetical protein
MNKVIYQNREIANWEDYILLKFADPVYFSILHEEERGIKVKSKTNNTIIWFELVPGDSTLYDCQYYNKDCKGYSGETAAVDPNKFGLFNQANVNRLNATLEVPIQIGWTSIDYYLGNVFYKSKSYEGQNRDKHILTYFGSADGCISIPLFPLFILLNILINVGIIGTKKKIRIGPIIIK